MTENNQQVPQQFAIQRLYVKDVSFETPMGPKVFTQAWKPKMSVDLNTSSKKIDDNLFEVVLAVTVTATLEEETACLIEAHQAGLFLVQGFDDENLRRALAIGAPSLLFPYVREVIDGLAVKGGFPAIGLQPVNFEALFAQAQAAARQKSDEASTH